MRKLFSAKQLRAIGSLAVEAAALDSTLEQLIWLMLEIPPKKGCIFTEKMQAKTRLETYKALAILEFDEKLPEDLEFSFNELSQLNVERNTFIHGAWLPVDGLAVIGPGIILKTTDAPLKIGEVSAHRGGSKKSKPLPADQVSKTADLISLHHNLALRLFHDHFSNTHLPRSWTFPRKSSKQLRKEIQNRRRKP